MSPDLGGELPPVTTAIDSAVFCRFRLDIEGAPRHRVLSPGAECAMQTARTR
jgi:hypothetical protein